MYASKNCMNLQQQGWVIVWQNLSMQGGVCHHEFITKTGSFSDIPWKGQFLVCFMFRSTYYKCVIPIMWSIHISCSQQIDVETFFYTHVTVASAYTRKRYVAVASTSRWFTYMYCLCSISTVGIDDWMALAIDKHVRYLAHFQAFPSSRFWLLTICKNGRERDIIYQVSDVNV